jgi:hypothetical protein
MIAQRIQQLYKDAVFKTAVQGTRCGQRGAVREFFCLYTNDSGQHCAVGHALPKELQILVGGLQTGVGHLAKLHPEVSELLGFNPEFLDEDYEPSNEQRLWTGLQLIHDEMRDEHRGMHRLLDFLRPFGVSWSAYFWTRARNHALDLGFDIGSYPRAEVRGAQVA